MVVASLDDLPLGISTCCSLTGLTVAVEESPPPGAATVTSTLPRPPSALIILAHVIVVLEPSVTVGVPLLKSPEASEDSSTVVTSPFES